MTVQAIAKLMLRRIGVTSLDPDANQQDANKRGIVTGDLEECALAITAALQEIYSDGPANLRERQVGAVLRVPTSVTFTATQYSTTISGFSGFASWMRGCTVRLSGDLYDNEIISATELMRPYMGSTGSNTATVYADAIQLPDNQECVMEPVETPNWPILTPCATKEEFSRFVSYTTSAPSLADTGSSYIGFQNKIAGDPRAWIAEARFMPGVQSIPIFLRFNPMPSAAIPVRYRTKIKPVTITAEDIGNTTTEPDLAIPVDWHESVLVPIALQRFTAHPALANNAVAIKEIGRQYGAAQRILAGWTPQVSTTQAEYR